MKKPIVTIGISAYNEEENIGKLLLNLLNQNTKNFNLQEVIVISDGSTDKTIEIVKKIKSKKIKLVEGKVRLGKNSRLNQIKELMHAKSDYLLICESDTLPKNKYYIKNLVSSIPSDKKFSIILSEGVPIEMNTLMGSIMRFGFLLRKEMFKYASQWPSIYMGNIRLLSRKFLKRYRWNNDYHDDSYCFRKALESNLPIIRNKKAIILEKPADTFSDYLYQSGKFQKAKDQESKISTLYKTNLDYKKALIIALKYFFNQPILFFSYVLLWIVARIYSRFLPSYTPLWKIYKSTKNLDVNIYAEK